MAGKKLYHESRRDWNQKPGCTSSSYGGPARFLCLRTSRRRRSLPEELPSSLSSFITPPPQAGGGGNCTARSRDEVQYMACTLLGSPYYIHDGCALQSGQFTKQTRRWSQKDAMDIANDGFLTSNCQGVTKCSGDNPEATLFNLTFNRKRTLFQLDSYAYFSLVQKCL